MNYKDNIEWLKSLKQQIGQTQHRDLWHFEQVIDETIDNLKPLATPHGRLIDADKLLDSFGKAIDEDNHFVNFFSLVESAPTIIEAEHKSEAQKWARFGRDISKGLQEGIDSIKSEVPE